MKPERHSSGTNRPRKQSSKLMPCSKLAVLIVAHFLAVEIAPGQESQDIDLGARDTHSDIDNSTKSSTRQDRANADRSGSTSKTNPLDAISEELLRFISQSERNQIRSRLQEFTAQDLQHWKHAAENKDPLGLCLWGIYLQYNDFDRSVTITDRLNIEQDRAVRVINSDDIRDVKRRKLGRPRQDTAHDRRLQQEFANAILSEAIDQYHIGARLGSAQCMWLLGRCYLQTLEFTVAEKWFRKASGLGYQLATVSLGECYLYGLGVAVDKAEAVRLFTLAAERQVPHAMFNLGVAHERSWGVASSTLEESEEHAIKWYQLAQKGNHSGAYHYLGFLRYRQSDRLHSAKGKYISLAVSEWAQGYRLEHPGCAFQYAQCIHLNLTGRSRYGFSSVFYDAKAWGQEQGQDLSYEESQIAAGPGYSEISRGNDAYQYWPEPLERVAARMFLHATCNSPTRMHARISSLPIPEIERWKEAAAMGDPLGHWLWGMCLKMGLRYRFGSNPKSAHEQFLLGAKEGSTYCMWSIGYHFWRGNGVEQNYVTGTEWFRKASKLGEPNATAALAEAYLEGYGVEKDQAEAVRLLTQVASEKVPIASFYLGVAHEWGWSVPIDLKRSAEFYRMAGDGGCAIAWFNLGMLAHNNHDVNLKSIGGENEAFGFWKKGFDLSDPNSGHMIAATRDRTVLDLMQSWGDEGLTDQFRRRPKNIAPRDFARTEPDGAVYSEVWDRVYREGENRKSDAPSR